MLIGHFLTPWDQLWRDDRRVAIRLLISAIVLLVCGFAFAISEMTALRTVHAFYPQHTTSVRLAAGTYSVDQDPDANDFPVALSALLISGPDGPVSVSGSSYDQSPTDLGGLFLGVGIFARAGRFTVTSPGMYRLSVADPAAGPRLLVSEPYSTSARQVGPWALGIVAALTNITLTGVHLRRRHRPPARRR